MERAVPSDSRRSLVECSPGTQRAATGIIALAESAMRSSSETPDSSRANPTEQLGIPNMSSSSSPPSEEKAKKPPTVNVNYLPSSELQELMGQQAARLSSPRRNSVDPAKLLPHLRTKTSPPSAKRKSNMSEKEVLPVRKDTVAVPSKAAPIPDGDNSSEETEPADNREQARTAPKDKAIGASAPSKEGETDKGGLESDKAQSKGTGNETAKPTIQAPVGKKVAEAFSHFSKRKASTDGEQSPLKKLKPATSGLAEKSKSDNVASETPTFSMQQSPEDHDKHVTLGSAVDYADCAEKIENVKNLSPGDRSEVFSYSGSDFLFRRYRNETFKPTPPPKPVDVPETTPVESEEEMSKRRSSRKKGPQGKAGSQVQSVEYPPDLLSHAIIELPDDAMPGDQILVTWPVSSDPRFPTVFLIEVPETVPPFKGKTRLLKVMAPGCFDKGKKRRLARNRYIPGSPILRRGNRLPAFSPQKAEWSAYTKSSSRVGDAYQVPEIPPSTTFQNEQRGKEEESMPGG